jgi:hypothetical protein
LGESDIDLDQNEVRKRCLHLMPDCDTAIGSATPALATTRFCIGAGFERWFAVTHL